MTVYIADKDEDVVIIKKEKKAEKTQEQEIAEVVMILGAAVGAAVFSMAHLFYEAWLVRKHKKGVQS